MLTVKRIWMWVLIYAISTAIPWPTVRPLNTWLDRVGGAFILALMLTGEIQRWRIVTWGRKE